MYSYVIGVADSKSVLGLFSTALVSKIFAFYHLLKMHKVDQDVVVMYTLVKICFSNYFNNYKSYEGFEGFDGGFVT